LTSLLVLLELWLLCCCCTWSLHSQYAPTCLLLGQKQLPVLSQGRLALCACCFSLCVYLCHGHYVWKMNQQGKVVAFPGAFPITSVWK
jgi:hypothetical protein